MVNSVKPCSRYALNRRGTHIGLTAKCINTSWQLNLLTTTYIFVVLNKKICLIILNPIEYVFIVKQI